MIKLNLGGGKGWNKEGWTNLDKKYGYDIQDKLLKEYKDNSIDTIYTSHFIEHLSPVDIFALFKDCYRVLKKGSLMRIVYPSVEKMYYLFRYNKKGDLIKSSKYYQKYSNREMSKDIEELLGFWGTTKHKAILDIKIVKLLLLLSSFDVTKIYEKWYNTSMLLELEKGFDKEDHILISDYIEVIR
jgi:predicted SAM-dependent methyltransferase